MALRQYNPVTPSLRGTVLIDRASSYKGKPVKTLTEGKNHFGRPQQPWPDNGSVPRRRHKQSYRAVDFKRRKFDVPATVERLEY